MIRISHVSAGLALAALFGMGLGAGCGESASDSTATDQDAIKACHLDDGTVEAGAKVHACDPQDTKKTTICHIPPGNPANAHTLCVGNPAVPAHLRNHGDYLGPCKDEVACVPPGQGAGGAPGGSDHPGTGGAPPQPVTGSGGNPPVIP